jgi:hypothetical protein
MKNSSYFQDFKFAFLNDVPLKVILPQDIVKKVLNSEAVQEQIQIELRKGKSGLTALGLQ